MGLKRGGWNFRMFTQPILEWVNRMQAILTLLALAGIAALLSGCAAFAAVPVASVVSSASGSALEIHDMTEVRLQEANFIVTKPNVAGQSGGFSLLGFLPIVPAKFSKALDRLHKQAQMQSGQSQTLANLIIEKNNTYLILFSLPRISIRADVIEFMPAAGKNTSPRPPPPEELESQTAEQ